MQHPSPSLPARRTRGRILALTLVMGLLALMSTTSASADPGKARTARASLDPLLVHLDTISPATLSDKDEPVTITGTVTNESAEQWTEINLYAIRSAAPIVDATSLSASAATDAGEFVGERVITPGTEATVDVLDPGETTTFSLTVPRSELGLSASGVYWLGVQASGLTATLPKDVFADGRARTFIPLVPRTGGKTPDTVEAAIVLPIRETVWFTPDGRVDLVGRWARSLGEGGRLSAILEAGDPATGAEVTWLIDPAVIAAAARLAAGNPPRSLAPDPAALPVEPTESPSEEPAPSGGAPATPDPYATAFDPVPQAEPDQELTEDEQQLAIVARAWLDRLLQVTSGEIVLSLPYGDLDVSAAAAHGPGYYEQAVTRSQQVMDRAGLAATPALAPRDGILSPAAISAATEDTTILLADTSFAGAVPPNAPESLVRLLGHKIVVTSSGASSGGPSPTAADDPLALRQRLLSEAALRLQSGTRSPVVMMLPADWKPTDPSALFDGLDARWLEQVSVGELGQRRAVSMNRGGLAYTDEDETAELGVTNFSSADQLTGRAGLLAGLLTQQNLVRQQVADEVLMSLSTGHRPNAARAADSVRAATDFVSEQLASVTVDAPDAVTLSSDSGQLGADIVNGLDQPVTVRIAVQSNSSLELEDLGERQIGADSRARILPTVTVSRPGIHQARLVVTDAQGMATGASTTLQIRAAQVSGLIWLLLAGGAALLFGTIGVRLVRRIRGRNSPASESTG